jgi:hypothetical protein
MASRYRHPPRRDPLNGYFSQALDFWIIPEHLYRKVQSRALTEQSAPAGRRAYGYVRSLVRRDHEP